MPGFIKAISNIIRRKNDKRKLLESRWRSRAFAAHVRPAAEEEEKKFYLEIHDNLAQILDALDMVRAAPFNKRAGEKQDALLGVVRTAPSALTHAVQRAVLRLRHTISEMRLDKLEKLVLGETIRRLLHEFQERTGIPYESDVQREAIGKEKERALSIYLMIREALNNIPRHSGAKCVRLSLHGTRYRCALRISGDSVGFSPDSLQRQKTFGFLMMKERAEMIGGELAVESAAGDGTTVRHVLMNR